MHSNSGSGDNPGRVTLEVTNSSRSFWFAPNLFVIKLIGQFLPMRIQKMNEVDSFGS